MIGLKTMLCSLAKKFYPSMQISFSRFLIPFFFIGWVIDYVGINSVILLVGLLINIWNQWLLIRFRDFAHEKFKINFYNYLIN
jgi:hypothetical protein